MQLWMLLFDQPGVYAFVNHDYAQLFKGQAGLIVVDGPDNGTSKLLGLTDDANPSNAIPPTGANSIPVNVKPYMLGNPLACNGETHNNGQTPQHKPLFFCYKN